MKRYTCTYDWINLLIFVRVKLVHIFVVVSFTEIAS